MRIHLATKRMQSGQMGCHARNGVGRVCICIFTVTPLSLSRFNPCPFSLYPNPLLQIPSCEGDAAGRLSGTMERRRGRAPWRGVGNNGFNQAGGSVNGGCDQTDGGSGNQGGGGGSGTGCDMDGEWRVTSELSFGSKKAMKVCSFLDFLVVFLVFDFTLEF